MIRKLENILFSTCFKLIVLLILMIIYIANCDYHNNYPRSA